eukprot:TRINITY_DN67960_c7_g2_i1.p1 TRINITY_DN67960_c7_g2~~TRINITY_DN67960_c7_g2_i1.p1  ORF type:complete len:221 (+),score=9.04 TRINITY_DN67960_c7_g2_i1:123-785(+)
MFNGVVWKFSRQRTVFSVQNWKQRHLRLTGTTLSYFETPTSKSAKGTFKTADIVSVACGNRTGSRSPCDPPGVCSHFYVTINDDGGAPCPFHLATGDPLLADAWMLALVHAVPSCFPARNVPARLLEQMPENKQLAPEPVVDQTPAPAVRPLTAYEKFCRDPMVWAKRDANGEIDQRWLAQQKALWQQEKIEEAIQKKLREEHRWCKGCNGDGICCTGCW